MFLSLLLEALLVFLLLNQLFSKKWEGAGTRKNKYVLPEWTETLVKPQGRLNSVLSGSKCVAILQVLPKPAGVMWAFQ